MSPHTILYINGTAELGGTDTDLLATVRALDKTRFTPIVMLPGPGPFDEDYAAMGVEVLHARLPVINRAVRPGQLVARSVFSMRELYRLIVTRNIDLVYTNSLLVLSGGIAARLAGRPALWHSGEFLDRPRLVGEALYWATGALATRIIVSSAAVRERFPAWARRKVDVVHNGVDLGRFRPDLDSSAIRRRLGIPAEVPLVGCVARFIPWKGVDQFVRIAARVRDEVPDTHFLIAGSRLAGYEQYTAEVRALIAELDLAGCTTVLENSLAVPDLMAAMDVFVHCSTRPEPFGIVIVEAMAAGKPVVAINAGGVPEIISEPDIGVLVPIGEMEQSARAVIRLLVDPERASALGRAARAHVAQHFDVHAVTRRVEAIYAAVLPAASATPTAIRALP